jgi:hypothetical protein
MIDLIIAALAGAVGCLVLLYVLGKRHQRHVGRTSGPNSRVPVSENVVPIVKKG